MDAPPGRTHRPESSARLAVARNEISGFWYDAVVGAASAAAAEVSDVAVVKWLRSASLQGFERIQHRGILFQSQRTLSKQPEVIAVNGVRAAGRTPSTLGLRTTKHWHKVKPNVSR